MDVVPGGVDVVSTFPESDDPPPVPWVSVTVIGAVVNVVLVVVPLVPAVIPVVVTPDTSSAQAETTKGTATRPILNSLFNISAPSSV